MHGYGIWSGLPASADSVRFQATCISYLHPPNTTGDDAGVTDGSHTPPGTTLRRAASDSYQQKCEQQKDTSRDFLGK